MNFSDTSKDDKLRKSLETEYDEKGADFMHEKLAALDEKSALKSIKTTKNASYARLKSILRTEIATKTI